MQVPTKVVVWGAAGHARVVADIIRLGTEFEIVGFLDDTLPSQPARMFCGAPVLGGREQLNLLLQQGIKHIFLAFGDCAARLRLADVVQRQGFSLATAIHPSAVIAADAVIGKGTVVAANAVVNPATQIGENVIVNTSASVDHDCVIEPGVHICPGVRMAGGVRIGVGTWVGIGATVIQQVRVGARTMIGAGAVVVGDIPDNVVAYGVPAKIIRELSHDG